MAMSSTGPRRGFTLIELLIVVAIIAILAAIAVPNFLEAQTRSKVSRARADMRTISTGLETYHVDNNSYPTGWGIFVGGNPDMHSLFLLSTPIAYLTSSDLQDPFWPKRDDRAMWTTFQYDPMTSDGRMFADWILSAGIVQPTDKASWWLLISVGPDKNSEFAWDYGNPEGLEARIANSDGNPGAFLDVVYDPTNGTVSRGEIFRAGGGNMNEAGRIIQRVQ